MITEVYTGNSPLAEELITKWNEKNAEAEKIAKEMKELKVKMRTEFSRFQNGDVIRNTEDGKKYVVVSAKVYESSLKGGYHTKPCIEFIYEVKPIRKDGMPSSNFSHIYTKSGFELTGERFNFQTQQYE